MSVHFEEAIESFFAGIARVDKPENTRIVLLEGVELPPISMCPRNRGRTRMLLLIGCSEPESFGDLEKEVVKRDIEEMFEHYFGDLLRVGLTSEFKYLDSSSDFFWVPPGYDSALSFDSVRAILESTADAFQTIDLRFDKLLVFPLATDIASYSGTVKGTMIDTAGVVTDVHMIESGVLFKRPDGWKLIGGQSRNLDGS